MDVSVDLNMDSINANIGQGITIPISVVSEKNQKLCGYTNYEAKIKFNNTVLLPIGNFDNVQNDGYYQILSINGQTVNDLLKEIQFIVALGNEICSDISVDQIEFDCADIIINKKNGKICLNDICIAPVARLFDATGLLYLSDNYPNPVDNKTTIKFGIIEEAYSKLYIVNSLGEIIDNIIEVDKPGDYEIQYNASLLTTGLFYIVLQTPTNKLIRKMNVIR